MSRHGSHLAVGVGPVRREIFVGGVGGRVAHPAVDLAFCVVCRCRLREVRPLRRGGCCHRCRGAGDGVWVFSSWRGADSTSGAVGRWPGGRSGNGIGRHVCLQPAGGFPNCVGQRCWGGGATGCCRWYRRREFVAPSPVRNYGRCHRGCHPAARSAHLRGSRDATGQDRPRR